jgi:hypothetical protein
MTSYKDYLRMKGLKPIVIERTKKLQGDKVVVTSCLPAVVVR